MAAFPKKGYTYSDFESGRSSRTRAHGGFVAVQGSNTRRNAESVLCTPPAACAQDTAGTVRVGFGAAGLATPA